MDSNLDGVNRPGVGRGGASRTPRFVQVTNKLVSRLVRVGMPVGPNAVLTVRGRKSGEPRSTPVAVVEIGGRRWLQSPYGQVNWIRNLRAAGEATLTKGRREEHLRAVELGREERIAFFRDVLGPYIAKGFFSRRMAGVLGMTDVIEDPAGAADRHPVFELVA